MEVVNRIRCVTVAALLLFGSCVGLKAAEYPYSPNSPLKLGGGYSPETPLRGYPDCVTITPKRVENTSVQTQYSMQLVSTREQLYSTIGISAVISAQYEMFSGGSNIEFDDATSFDDGSLNFVVKASDDFGKVDASDGVNLTPAAQKLIDTKQWGAFAQKCGTEVVLQEEKAASIVAIYSFRNLSSQEQQSLKVILTGAASVGVFSATSNMTLNQAIQEANQTSTVQVSIFALGGDGLKSLSGLLEGSQDAAKVEGIFDQYIQGINFDTAAPSLYITGSFSSFGWVGQPVETTVNDDFIEQLNFLREDTASSRDRLKELSSQGGNSPYDQLVTDPQRTAYSILYSKYVDAITAITEKALACQKAVAQCSDIKSVYPPPVQWPLIPPAPQMVNVTISSVPDGMHNPPYNVTELSHKISGTILADPRFVKYMYIWNFAFPATSIPSPPFDKLGPWIGAWQDLSPSGNPDPQDAGMNQAVFSGYSFEEALTCQYSGPFGDFCHNGLGPFMWKDNSETGVYLYSADVFGQQRVQKLWPAP